MRKLIVKCVFFALLVVFAFALTSCNRNQEVIRVFNWGNFIDESIFAEFTEQTGIRVLYQTFASNEELYTRVSGGDSGFDLIFPSDYMIERMIREDLLLPLNFDNIPNIRYIDERFFNLAFDPENRYSVPYKWGTLGILYNTTMVGDVVIDSWEALWNPQFYGNVFMYDSKRDSFAVALNLLGYSINTTNLDELNAARDLLMAQRRLGVVRAFVGDYVINAMIGREAALAVTFSGDAMFTIYHNPELNYVVPREGSNIWFDSMVIPRGARNQAGAEAFINFMTSPEIAYRNTMYTWYSTTNWATFNMLPPEMRYNPVYWPSDEVYYNAEVFVHLGDFTEEYNRAWMEVLLYRP